MIPSAALDPASAAGILARLDRVPASRWHVKVRAVLGAGLIFDAFDLLAMSFALPAFVKEWELTQSQAGWILSSAFIGQLLGALVVGWLADRVGRLPIIAAAIGLFSAMSLACAFASGFTSLIAFRMLQGFGLGAEVPISNTYISEIAPSQVRGRFYILFQMIFAIGLICAGFAGYVMVPLWGWQSMFYLGTLPFLLVFIIPFLPESPRWLVSKGRLDKASAIVTMLEAAATSQGKALPPVRPMAPPPAPRERNRWLEAFQGRYRHRTFAVWAMWYCCFSTTYGLQAWLPTLYRTNFHFGVQQSNLYGFITQCCGLVASLACAFSIDRTGRRPWFLIAFIGGGVTLLTLSVVGPSTAEILLVFVSIGGMFMSCGSTGLNLYTSELYPTRIRAFASAIGGAWQRVAAAVGPLVIGYLAPIYGLGPVFYYFGGLALAGAVVTAFFADETGGRPLEEVSP